MRQKRIAPGRAPRPPAWGLRSGDSAASAAAPGPPAAPAPLAPNHTALGLRESSAHLQDSGAPVISVVAGLTGKCGKTKRNGRNSTLDERMLRKGAMVFQLVRNTTAIWRNAARYCWFKMDLFISKLYTKPAREEKRRH